MKTPLRKVREVLRLTQAQMADAVGIDTTNYCRIEAGIQAPRPETAAKISEFFGGAVSEIHIVYPNRFPRFLGFED